MWPEPVDPDVTCRMRMAHRHARRALRAQPAIPPREAWGWQGRSLGLAVVASDGPAWLRVAAAPAGEADATFWNGAVDAERVLPRTIPRPRLHRWHDWQSQHWQYRAELYAYLPAGPVSSAPVLTETADLPDSWWVQMRSALADMAAVPTGRVAVRQQFLDYAMPRWLGGPASTRSPSPWAAAHGDFHFANICAPVFCAIDFEGWGMAPEGYDAATLHTFSLLVPETAARIRRELAHLLDTPAGRYAELVVITERLHAASSADDLALQEPLRRRAATLLGRGAPTR